MLSEGGESEIVREVKMPLISRKSSETWSLGVCVRSLMKSLIERMMGGQDSSFGSHQSEGPAPIDSSIRFRRTSEYMYLREMLVNLKPIRAMSAGHMFDNCACTWEYGAALRRE